MTKSILMNKQIRQLRQHLLTVVTSRSVICEIGGTGKYRAQSQYKIYAPPPLPGIVGQVRSERLGAGLEKGRGVQT